MRKTSVISNFMTSEPGKKTIVIYNCNIWISKANQTMKFYQLIEYSMRNIFLEKSFRKCDGEASCRPFSSKLKLSLALD